MPAVDRDTGLGTTYERIAVAGLLEELAARLRVDSVLEGPTDGITGIRGLNSIPLAQQGASVELVLGDPDELRLARGIWNDLGLADRLTARLADGDSLGARRLGFDLVWNFNSLPQVADARRLVGEMCDASRRYVLVFVSNTWNYGFPVHRLHHVAAREEWSHGEIETMNTPRIERMLVEKGFRVRERLLVDVPWWPDIDSPIEEVAATFLPFLRRFVSGSKRLERYTWTRENLPYFDATRRRELEGDLSRHSLIERARWCPLRVFFAHHRGVLAERALESVAPDSHARENT